jgi:uncharacterized protein (TIGR02996 family)
MSIERLVYLLGPECDFCEWWEKPCSDTARPDSISCKRCRIRRGLEPSGMNEQHVAFLKAIADDPEDKDRMRIFADWLEENAQPDAAGWRWLADEGLMPRKVVVLFRNESWQWGLGSGEKWCLSDNVFQVAATRGSPSKGGRSLFGLLDYDTQIAALQAAAAAYSLVQLRKSMAISKPVYPDEWAAWDKAIRQGGDDESD